MQQVVSSLDKHLYGKPNYSPRPNDSQVQDQESWSAGIQEELMDDQFLHQLLGDLSH